MTADRPKIVTQYTQFDYAYRVQVVLRKRVVAQFWHRDRATAESWAARFIEREEWDD